MWLLTLILNLIKVLSSLFKQAKIQESAPTPAPTLIKNEPDKPYFTQDGLNMVKLYEGCKLEAYIDPVGILTIGYGHTRNVLKDMRITDIEALRLLKLDVAAAVKYVKSYVTYPINSNMLSALTDFVFNLGCGSLKNSTLLKLLNKGDIENASLEFLKWDHAIVNGKTVTIENLRNRRKAECKLFLTPGDGIPADWS